MTMDYYEVLGVRRTAGMEEIELAFKGRRAQYHPDRYSARDADTLQWATQQMQAVNEAYAVLSDARRRADYDQCPVSSADRPAAPGAPTPTVQISLRQLWAQRLPSSEGLGRIYLAPNIPLKKLSAALGHYGHDLDAEDVIGLVDTTVFGGSKEGMILTEQGLLIKEIATPRRLLAWRQIKNLQVSDTTLFVEGRKLMDCPMVDASAMAVVFGVVAEFVAALKASPPDGAQGAQSDDLNKPQATASSPPCQNSTCRPGPGQDAGKTSPSSKASWDPHLFDRAKARLVEVCSLIEAVEQRHDRELVDRSNAVQYFAHLKACSRDPHDAPAVEQELQRIAEVCEEILSMDQGQVSLKGEALGDEDEDDSQLVAELRFLIRMCLDGFRNQQRKAEVERFFKR